MSCYEWENGTIIIPSKEWAKFRTAVVQRWNEYQLDVLERAKRLHARLKDAAKGKRGDNRVKALRGVIFEANPEWEVRHLVVEGPWHAMTLKTSLPKKRDLKLLPTSKDCVLSLGEASITLTNKTRTVHWDVPENNHAREHAREHVVAKKLFALLDRITWTRGSGGKLVGNDEYARDAGHGCEGGGGNYVTATYGPRQQGRRSYQQMGYGGW